MKNDAGRLSRLTSVKSTYLQLCPQVYFYVHIIQVCQHNCNYVSFVLFRAYLRQKYIIAIMCQT